MHLVNSQILYVADSLDITGMGGGVAAGNQLLALLASGRSLTVLTRRRVVLPKAVAGISLFEPAWITWGEIQALYPPQWHQDYFRSLGRFIYRRQKHLSSIWTQLRTIFDICRAVRHLRPQLIILQGPSACQRLAGFRHLKGSPIWICLHGSPDQWSGIYHNNVNRLPEVCRLMASGTAMIQLSSVLARKWAAQGQLAAIPTHIIPNTLNEDALQVIRQTSKAQLRSELGISSDQFAAVCTASIQPRKAQDVLCYLLDRLITAVPNLHLYFIGPVAYQWGGAEIIRQFRQHKHAARVHFMGRQTPQTAACYTRAADLFVLPSREEAMPLAVLEAMFLETPVVASDVDGIPDQIEHGRSGLLFSHAYPEGLAEGIIRMAADAEFRAQCARAAHEKYWCHFNRKLYFESWRKLLDRFFAENRKGCSSLSA